MQNTNTNLIKHYNLPNTENQLSDSVFTNQIPITLPTGEGEEPSDKENSERLFDTTKVLMSRQKHLQNFTSVKKESLLKYRVISIILIVASVILMLKIGSLALFPTSILILILYVIAERNRSHNAVKTIPCKYIDGEFYEYKKGRNTYKYSTITFQTQEGIITTDSYVAYKEFKPKRKYKMLILSDDSFLIKQDGFLSEILNIAITVFFVFVVCYYIEQTKGIKIGELINEGITRIRQTQP
jgi:hypothetical protein